MIDSGACARAVRPRRGVELDPPQHDVPTAKWLSGSVGPIEQRVRNRKIFRHISP